MKQQSKFLKVISIILIVLGSLSFISSIIMVARRGDTADLYAAYGISAPSTLTYIVSFTDAIISLTAGIVGVVYKSRKSVFMLMILYFAFTLLSIVITALTVGFTVLSLFSFILPLLYLWGWYQSN